MTRSKGRSPRVPLAQRYATPEQKACTNWACAKASYSLPQIIEALKVAGLYRYLPANYAGPMIRSMAAHLDAHNCLDCTPRTPGAFKPDVEPRERAK